MSSFNSITTRKGDSGESGLIGGGRMKKSEPVFAALGEVDELSCVIGLAKAFIRQYHPEKKAEVGLLASIQSDLVGIGTQIATPDAGGEKKQEAITTAHIDRLEKLEESYLKNVEMPKSFVFPGATVAGAGLDFSRAVCRRAERQLVSYISQRQTADLNNCLVYLNRLSDLLYILARRLEK